MNAHRYSIEIKDLGTGTGRAFTIVEWTAGGRRLALGAMREAKQPDPVSTGETGPA